MALPSYPRRPDQTGFCSAYNDAACRRDTLFVDLVAHRRKFLADRASAGAHGIRVSFGDDGRRSVRDSESDWDEE